MKIGIAGAGLLGRLLALQLARAGNKVTVFDPANDPEHRVAAGCQPCGI
jgi:glycine oxidase